MDLPCPELDTADVAEKPFESGLPGDFAIWVFILAELTTFAVFFVVYAFARTRHVTLFNAGQAHLDLNIGAINTCLLITGSWFVVRGVHAIQHDKVKQSVGWLLAALGSGAGFIYFKLGEYADKAAQGVDMSTDTFYMFYFSLTYFHMMHVLLGMAFIAIVLFHMLRGAYGAGRCATVESAGAYWHMVDLLWIVLFPLVYVMH